MNHPSIILFTGSEAGGFYNIINIFRNLGINCGYSFPSLRGPLAARHMPPHKDLSFWSAIRRFFSDMGLPPVAEVPSDRINDLEKEYYARLFCRCLEKLAKNGPYICASHFMALALPLIFKALEMGRFHARIYFFFDHPEREAAFLLQKFAQPVKLSEYAWSNSVNAAIRHGLHTLRFIALDTLKTGFSTFAQEILQFFGISRREIPELVFLPDSNSFLFNNHLSLSSQTLELYKELLSFTKNGENKNLEKMVSENYASFLQYNGWQYYNCIDIGNVAPQNRLLLNESHNPYPIACEECCQQLPDSSDNNSWFELLEKTEHRLLEAQNFYASQLFLHTDSLAHFYMNHLNDEFDTINIERNRKKEITEKICRQKIICRHKRRIRKR